MSINLKHPLAGIRFTKSYLFVFFFILASYVHANDEICPSAFSEHTTLGKMDLAESVLKVGRNSLPHFTVSADKLTGDEYYQQKVLVNDIASGPTLFIGMMEMGHSYMVVCSDAAQNKCISFHAGVNKIAPKPTNSAAIFRGTVLRISDPDGSLVTAMTRALHGNPELYSYTCANGICRLFDQIGAPLVNNIIDSVVPSALMHRVLKNGGVKWCGQNYPVSVVSVGSPIETINLIPATSSWLKSYIALMRDSKKACKAK